VGNASMNTFVNTYVRHENGTGVYFQNADTNTFVGLRCTRLLSETGLAILFGQGGQAVGEEQYDNRYARTNHIYNMHSSQGEIQASGDTGYFPSVDNIIYMNLDGASALQTITKQANATLTVVSARQHNITSQNLVAVGNSDPSNFHNTPFTAGTAKAYFETEGAFPANIYGNGGEILQFYDLPNDAKYQMIAGATGCTWLVPTNIVNPEMSFNGWTVVAKNYESQGNQVVSGRKTGWTAATGTATKTTFDTTTVTTEQLAERVKALIDDLISHGLIGA